MEEFIQNYYRHHTTPVLESLFNKVAGLQALLSEGLTESLNIFKHIDPKCKTFYLSKMTSFVETKHFWQQKEYSNLTNNKTTCYRIVSEEHHAIKFRVFPIDPPNIMIKLHEVDMIFR